MRDSIAAPTPTLRLSMLAQRSAAACMRFMQVFVRQRRTDASPLPINL